MNDSIEQGLEFKEMKDCCEKFFQLEEQLRTPTRDGMIKALSEAQTVAFSEITNVEHSQGDTIPMPWQSFSDADLYRKLKQYQQGILNHCINKFGEKAFQDFLKTMQR